jgi:hypothetical protein
MIFTSLFLLNLNHINTKKTTDEETLLNVDTLKRVTLNAFKH